mmetsp:Transcript_43745/g.105513  ORF Transcript_43745/g.105513 Transcript_43745/m.105513 type:complete len:272 (-) Transcript_43745:219-1034(-)
MTMFTPVKATTTGTPQAKPSRGLPSNLLSFCTPSKVTHFEDSDEDEYPNTIIKSRSATKQDFVTPATVNESPLSLAESVNSSDNLMSLSSSSEDDSSTSAAGVPKRLGFDKPTQISFDEQSDDSSPLWWQKMSSSPNAKYLVLAFALLLLRLIWVESSSVKANIRLSPQIMRFESFEDYQQAPRQFTMPLDIDHLPDIRSLKFYKLEQDESGPFLASVEGNDLLTPRPFSLRWFKQTMKQRGTEIKETSAFLKEKSEDGISEVLQDDHVLI